MNRNPQVKGKYVLEFLSVFVAVISAFALNNWNDNRQDHNAELKILEEIKNGLIKDAEDVQLNVFGHTQGVKACNYWRSVATGQEVATDSVMSYYFNLTRDFVSIQNRAAFESLKARGLELIQNDSLRLEIISLYEYHFRVMEKLEEEYGEMQFHNSYFHAINAIVSPYFVFDEKGSIINLQTPLGLSDAEKNHLLSLLWKIKVNRIFILTYYSQVQDRADRIAQMIDRELSSNE